ncbi:Aquaporin-like domain-containing protein [Strongyloides ratti]|uniref:Aquaporin-like domain-containing protein n=1 Tax=Strongyloides ratti TaxID=34506 RepID=A0A090LUM1_STRRB|nr:Aquaporin-like domain-containing protein [Strongyloides ratti]CEF71319.1 Aquaporin-like domain-containing protein [Strongyloides ratti]
MDVFLLKPAIICILFYITCFGLGELGPIGTLQMCTCVYENGLMIKNYGPMGFFFTVTSLLCFANSWNRGAFVSPLAPFEMFFYKTINLKKFVTVVCGQFLGGAYAFFLAKMLWFYTKNYSEEHEFALESTKNCILGFKVSYIFVLLFEITGCFCIRLIISKLPEKAKFFAIPMTIAGFLTLGVVYIGVGGLNPTVAASRLFGCAGLDTVWFIITYWIAPIIGWMAAAHLIHTGLLKSGKKNSKIYRKPSSSRKNNETTGNKKSKKGKKKKDN